MWYDGILLVDVLVFFGGVVCFSFPPPHLIVEHRAIVFIRLLNIYANSYVSNICIVEVYLSYSWQTVVVFSESCFTIQ